MPNLATLESILQANNNQRPHYFLFMLGTDTQYTHRPTEHSPNPAEQKTYKNGETLSYMAQVIAQQLDEENQPDENERRVSFKTHSIEVVNGPSTLGSDVGELIAKGVMSVLQALAQGKNTIHILGHSRGAVESILIAHELERIKEALEQYPDKTIKQILVSTPCQYTKIAFEAFQSSENETVELRTALLNALNEAQIHMFLIDPVPGGRFRGIPGTGWTDERFYKKPPCATAELLIARDERTRCFIPISPNGFRPLLMAGHHGTASGNLYSQQYENNPDGHDTSHVQKLLVCKLIQFIHQNTRIFHQHKQISLEHPVLDAVTNNFIPLSTAARAAGLLSLYSTIHENDRAYQHFANTSYPYLGTEKTTSQNRYIHFGSHNYMALDMAVPRLNGQFVNTEHAHLYLHDAIGFDVDENTNVLESLIVLRNTLNNLFITYIQTADTDQNNKVRALLNNVQDRAITFEAVSFFIDRLSQQYLRNHLTPQAKKELLDIIESTFNLFESSKGSDDINSIIDECTQILKAAIKNTAQNQNLSLITQVNMLWQNATHYLASSEVIEQAYSAFQEELAKVEENLSPTISAFIETINGSAPPSVEKISACFRTQLPRLLESDNISDREAAAFILECSGRREINLTGLMEAYITHPKDIKSQLVTLCENIKNLREGYSRVCRLASVEVLNFVPADLEYKEEQINRLIAQMDDHIRKEEQAALIISTQLIPLTQQYLEHLKKKLQKQSARNISNPEHITPVYGPLQKKHDLLENILNELKNTQSMPIPSHRIHRFKQSLNKIQADLKAHRDPQWVGYFKACMVAIAVICTGIIPGLMALKAYAAYTNQSSLTFFTQSHGARYLNQMEAITPSIAG